MAAMSEQRAKPTYIRMCIIHAEQHLKDLFAIKVHCISGTPEQAFIDKIIKSKQQYLEDLRLADMHVSQQIHEIERLL